MSIQEEGTTVKTEINANDQNDQTNTRISPDVIEERIRAKYWAFRFPPVAPLTTAGYPLDIFLRRCTPESLVFDLMNTAN